MYRGVGGKCVCEGAKLAVYAPSTTTTNKTTCERILIGTNRRNNLKEQFAYNLMEIEASPGRWGGCVWDYGHGS